MAALKRASVAAPVLPKEAVAVASLGGDLIVRGLLLTERLSVQSKITALQQDAGSAGGVHALLPMLLALCVLDADGVPLWTQDQWQAFGAQQQNEAIALFNAAWRLSGFNQAEEEKN